MREREPQYISFYTNNVSIMRIHNTRCTLLHIVRCRYYLYRNHKGSEYACVCVCVKAWVCVCAEGWERKSGACNEMPPFHFVSSENIIAEHEIKAMCTAPFEESIVNIIIIGIRLTLVSLANPDCGLFYIYANTPRSHTATHKQTLAQHIVPSAKFNDIHDYY